MVFPRERSRRIRSIRNRPAHPAPSRRAEYHAQSPRRAPAHAAQPAQVPAAPIQVHTLGVKPSPNPGDHPAHDPARARHHRPVQLAHEPVHPAHQPVREPDPPVPPAHLRAEPAHLSVHPAHEPVRKPDCPAKSGNLGRKRLRRATFAPRRRPRGRRARPHPLCFRVDHPSGPGGIAECQPCISNTNRTVAERTCRGFLAEVRWARCGQERAEPEFRLVALWEAARRGEDRHTGT